MLKRIVYGAALALAGSIGLALAAAGPTTVLNLWNPGGYHGIAPGLAAKDGSDNIAPGVALYDKNGAPNDATHPAHMVPGDGTREATFKAAATAPVAGDTAQVVALSPNSVDPCANPNIAKSSAVINIGAAATTKVVDVSASTVIYACGFSASTAGTATTVTWKYGTHASADCDTGAASLSGAFNFPVAGTVHTMGNGGSTLFKTAAAQQLCVTTAGSGSGYTGLLTYVQQ